MMTKIELEIKRPDGTLDMVDVSSKCAGDITPKVLAMYRAATLGAGRGQVICAHVTTPRNNGYDLAARINHITNEGGEGYELDDTMMIKHPEYKTWIETKKVY